MEETVAAEFRAWPMSSTAGLGRLEAGISSIAVGSESRKKLRGSSRQEDSQVTDFTIFTIVRGPLVGLALVTLKS